MSKVNLSAPNLTEHPPRSLRVRLGGYAHLARLLDKARAVIAGLGGDYHYNCPLDQAFFGFTGLDHEALFAEIKKGGTDWEIVGWVNANTKRQKFEVVAWSAWIEQHGPGGVEGHEWIAGVIKGDSPDRDDIRSFAEMLDMDDYVTFGGRG